MRELRAAVEEHRQEVERLEGSLCDARWDGRRTICELAGAAARADVHRSKAEQHDGAVQLVTMH